MRFFRERVMGKCAGNKRACGRSVSEEEARCSGNDYEFLHEVSPTRDAHKKKCRRKTLPMDDLEAAASALFDGAVSGRKILAPIGDE
jgi:hypothetical protein